MQSKTNQPTKKQIEWREQVRAMGCVNHPGIVPEIHHVVGAAGRENRVRIGQWFLLPLCSDCHRLDPNHNVTSWPKRYVERFGSQKGQFFQLTAMMIDQGIELPFGLDVINAIAITRK